MVGRKSKIKRNSLFYSEKDFELDIRLGIDYVSNDMNQTVFVFQIDRNKNVVDNLYGESLDDSIPYKDPIEINVIFNIEESNNKSYDKSQGLARYLMSGNLSFNVYEKTLIENKIDITYGDYIGVQIKEDQMEYFEVVNDGRVNFDNLHTLYGLKSYFRTVICAPVDKNIFNGK